MEPRLGERRPIAIDGMIHHRAIPATRCTIRNLGPRGMYVETGATAFPRNDALEVEFALRCDGRMRRYRLPVLAVHRFRGLNLHGIGLLFRTLDERAEHSIRAWLHARRRGRAA